MCLLLHSNASQSHREEASLEVPLFVARRAILQEGTPSHRQELPVGFPRIAWAASAPMDLSRSSIPIMLTHLVHWWIRSPRRCRCCRQDDIFTGNVFAISLHSTFSPYKLFFFRDHIAATIPSANAKFFHTKFRRKKLWLPKQKHTHVQTSYLDSIRIISQNYFSYFIFRVTDKKFPSLLLPNDQQCLFPTTPKHALRDLLQHQS